MASSVGDVISGVCSAMPASRCAARSTSADVGSATPDANPVASHSLDQDAVEGKSHGQRCPADSLHDLPKFAGKRKGRHWPAFLRSVPQSSLARNDGRRAADPAEPEAERQDMNARRRQCRYSSTPGMNHGLPEAAVMLIGASFTCDIRVGEIDAQPRRDGVGRADRVPVAIVVRQPRRANQIGDRRSSRTRSRRATSTVAVDVFETAGVDSSHRRTGTAA